MIGEGRLEGDTEIESARRLRPLNSREGKCKEIELSRISFSDVGGLMWNLRSSSATNVLGESRPDSEGWKNRDTDGG